MSSSSRRSWKRKNSNNDDDDEDNHYPRHVSRRAVKSIAERSVASIVSAADTAELERHYTFLPPTTTSTTTTASPSQAQNKKSSLSWQQRMVQHYHQHLYKEFVIADLSAVVQPHKQYHRIGLRWRSRLEVEQGKGELTCGNKHCPSFVLGREVYYDTQLPPIPNNNINNSTSNNKSSSLLTNATVAQKLWFDYYNKISNHLQSQQQPSNQQHETDEWALIQRMPHGIGLNDYEVNFRYQEQDEQGATMVSKQELVKLRLCIKCAPLVFLSKVVGVAKKTTTTTTDDDAAKRNKKYDGDDDHVDDDDDSLHEELMARAAWAARAARHHSSSTVSTSSSSVSTT